MFDLLQALVVTLDRNLTAVFLVFLRVSALSAMLPGFGESFLSMRLRLAVAVALTVLIFPAVDIGVLPADPDPSLILRLGAVEVGVGLMLGIALRFVVMALQYAGTIAAQTTALAQMAGAGLAPDPMPAIGNALMIAGLTLAMALGLHVKVVLSVLASYQVFGFGTALPASDVTAWGVAHAMAGAALAFSLAAPFVIAAFLYNIALGAINRAMPQLMVAFVGAPAITAATLLLLLLSAPVILGTWHESLDHVLGAPGALPR